MILTCVDNRGSSQSNPLRRTGAIDISVYALTPGQRYVVLGMLLWENVLSVLVRDDWGLPCYAPAGLFEMGVMELPPGWKLGLFPGLGAAGPDGWSDPHSAEWGYPELLDDPQHGARLVEGEPDALEIFAVRLAEAEAGYTTRPAPRVVEDPVAEAVVVWRSVEQGGRQGGPPELSFFTPLAAFVFDGAEWMRPGLPANEVPTVNALVQRVQRYDDGSWLCRIDFLDREVAAPYLRPGRTFRLVEGTRHVADGEFTEVYWP